MGMLLYKKVPYSFAESNYEINVFYDNNTINIVAFKNHYPANGFRHQIKISKNLVMKEILQYYNKRSLTNSSKYAKGIFRKKDGKD
jgi:hypothetical protein